MGLLASLALIRVWAALADRTRPRRAVAMTEGEVAVVPRGYRHAAADRRAGRDRGHLASRLRHRDGDRGSRGRRDAARRRPRAAGRRKRASWRRACAADARDHLCDRRARVRAQLLARQLPQRRRRCRPQHRGGDGQRPVRLQPARTARGQPAGAHAEPGTRPGHRARLGDRRPSIPARRHQRERGRGRHRPRRRRHRCTLSPDFLAAHPGQWAQRRQRARRDSHRCGARDDQRAARRRRDRPGQRACGPACSYYRR